MKRVHVVHIALLVMSSLLLLGAECQTTLPIHGSKPAVKTSNPKGQGRKTMSEHTGDISIDSVKWNTGITVPIKAEPKRGTWTKISDFIWGGVLIKLEVVDDKASWSYAGAAECKCGPDGDPGSLLSAQNCLMPSAPVGALIAKVGGSQAGMTDGKLFLVGSFAVIQLDPTACGPLYLSINDEPSGMAGNTGEIKVHIQMAHDKTVADPANPKKG